ncbi:GGDEF domain-containing protein [Desulfoluna spongiiphila]|uniref:diguanylate cyclase n=1 Tax=Desulfoluna spongiiphila TaxID=419481 RepID=A0A1G5I8H8_9BACT|nr:GGDEF domain-containing protein [Desulfoluna spongiiphila]SCY71980.1 diguanylate cyclase (GGDEF) domain-containing protein [Desulfoluna spongiiphila]
MSGTTFNQGLRIKRFAMAATTYLMWLGLFAYVRYMGLSEIPWPVLWRCAFLVTLCNIALLAVFLSGLNRWFKDPSLTLFQMGMGTFWVMVGVYYSGEARGGLLLLYLVVFVYGLFRLKVRQFLFLSAFAIGSYAAVLFFLHRQDPSGFNTRLEVMNLLILMVVLPWFSLVGGYITSLREKVARAMATIEKLAIHDDLTQVFNRRQMFQILEREKALGDRGVHPFSICIFDLDHFKRVNDTFGHEAGNTVLRTVAQAIQKNLRDIDHIARYGGEEFILILTNSGVSEAMQCAERVRALTEGLSYEGLPADFRVTISVGVTKYTPSEDIKASITRADDALYRAKRNGRNRVEYEPAGRLGREGAGNG